MDIGKAFTFTFEDEDWLPKILVGGLFALLSVVLIGVPFVYGYYLETMKNVYLGNPRPLPKWGDGYDALFTKGLKAIVGLVIWSLPGILVACLFGGLSGAAGSGSAANQDTFNAVYWCGQCLSSLYSIAVYAIMPAALMKFSVSGEIGEFFKFGEIFRFISRNLGNYIIAIIVGWLATLVGYVGIIGCLVGIVFTAFWSLLVGAHLYGQVYRLAKPA